MQFLVKLQAVGLMQLYKKQAPSRLFFKDFSADFSTNSLKRAISGKPTSLERLQWLLVSYLLFLHSKLTFTCPKLAQ